MMVLHIIEYILVGLGIILIIMFIPVFTLAACLAMEDIKYRHEKKRDKNKQKKKTGKTN